MVKGGTRSILAKTTSTRLAWARTIRCGRVSGPVGGYRDWEEGGGVCILHLMTRYLVGWVLVEVVGGIRGERGDTWIPFFLLRLLVLPGRDSAALSELAHSSCHFVVPSRRHGTSGHTPSLPAPFEFALPDCLSVCLSDLPRTELLPAPAMIPSVPATAHRMRIFVAVLDFREGEWVGAWADHRIRLGTLAVGISFEVERRI